MRSHWPIKEGDRITIDGPSPTREITDVTPVPGGVSIATKVIDSDFNAGDAPAPSESSQPDRGGGRDFDIGEPIPGTLAVTESRLEEHVKTIAGGVIVLTFIEFARLLVEIF